MTIGQTFHYRQCTGSALVSVEDQCLHGRILFIDGNHALDIVTYEGNTVQELRAAFEAAVDRYIPPERKDKTE